MKDTTCIIGATVSVCLIVWGSMMAAEDLKSRRLHALQTQQADDDLRESHRQDLLSAIRDNGCASHIDMPAPKNLTNADTYKRENL